MRFYNKQTGRTGEDLAARTLLDKGFKILARNFSNRFGEIDIIAQDNKILVFVEVKAKKGEDFGMPEEMINPNKLRKIQNMATLYMQGKNLPCRIDVIAVVLSPENNPLRITHYENVYFM